MPVSLPSGKLRLSAILMIFAIIGIGVFQGYWLKKLYAEERAALQKETNIAFRDAIYKLQWQRFQSDTASSGHPPISLFLIDMPDSIRDELPDQDTTGKPRMMAISFKKRGPGDSNLPILPSAPGLRQIMPDTTGAPLPISQIDSAFRRELDKSEITIPFTIRSFLAINMDSLRRLTRDSVPTDRIRTSIAYFGLSKARGYQADFGNSTGYLLGRLKLPISMALLLLAFITAAFVFLYFNLQQRTQPPYHRPAPTGGRSHHRHETAIRKGRRSRSTDRHRQRFSC